MFLCIGPFQFSFPSDIDNALLYPAFRPFLSLNEKDAPIRCTVQICPAHEMTSVQSNEFRYAYPDCLVSVDQRGMQARVGFCSDAITSGMLSKAVSTIMSMLLLMKSGLFLHSAAVEYEGKAVAFSADSGTGKSTQANLWERVLGASIINHDKPMFVKQNGTWFISGSPWSGEDPCYRNVVVPLRCIVFLSQGCRNEITIPNVKEKITILSRQVRLSVHLQEWYDQMLKVMEELIQDVPMIKYSCTMDDSAATDLLLYLQGEGWL